MTKETNTKSTNQSEGMPAGKNGDEIHPKGTFIAGASQDLDDGSATRGKTNSIVRVLSAAAGILMALCISLAVRLDTGYPPGVEPKAFSHLLGLPALDFVIAGLEGQPISPDRLREGWVREKGVQGWILFFTNSNCKACDATYPSLREAGATLPAVIIGVGKRANLANKMAKHSISARVAFDSLGTVGQKYDVQMYPSALLISAEGIVLTAATGVRSVDRILEEWKLWEEDRI